MSTTLPNMGLVQPTPGGDSGTWDDTMNANLAIEDEHTHEPGKGLRVPTAGLNINADLTFNSLYAPKDLHRLTFASIVALTSNNKSLFVSDGTGGLSANELYWRSNTGTNVKLTAGNALNVAAFTGGFGAGYTSASAAADYDDSTEQYTFKQASAGNWSRAGFGGIRLYEFGTSETVRVGLLAPAALAVSYDITMPLAAPASTQIVQMSSAGVLTASNTVANAVTLTGGITNNVSLAAGATAASGQTITSPTFSAATDYKHTFITTVKFVVGRQVINFAAGASLTNSNLDLALGTSTLPMTLAAVPLPRGYIQQLAVVVAKASGPGTITIELRSRTLGLVGTYTQSATATAAALFTPATPTTWPAGQEWYLLVSGGGTTGDVISQMDAQISNP